MTENCVISNKYHAVAGQSVAAEANEKASRARGHGSFASDAIRGSPDWLAGTPPSRSLLCCGGCCQRGRARRGQRNPMDFKYLYAWIISRSLSSEERSPPLASGWWRFTRPLKRVLDVLRRGAGVEAKRVERLAFGIVHGAGLSPPVGTSRARRPAELTKHAKRIVGSADFRMKAGRAGPRRWPSAVHAHLPRRAMADDRLFLILRDVFRVHPGEKIVGLVVLPHVIEAEPPIFPLTQPPFGRAVSCGRLAVRPIAGRGLGIYATIFVGLYPDAVE